MTNSVSHLSINTKSVGLNNMEKYCECGCGQKLDFSKGRKVKRFIHGHNKSGLGHKPSKETIRKMLETRIKNGNLFPSAETKRKMRESSLKNENHHMWKGDKAGYVAINNWVRRRKPKKEFCKNCGKKKILYLANISGKYKRDINDYEWLCHKCHMEKDGVTTNLIRMSKEKKAMTLCCYKCSSTVGRFKKGMCIKCYNKERREIRKKQLPKITTETIEKLKMMGKDSHGRFVKGNGYWLGKKRPDVTLRNINNNPMKQLATREKSSLTHKKMYSKKENHPRFGKKKLKIEVEAESKLGIETLRKMGFKDDKIELKYCTTCIRMVHPKKGKCPHCKGDLND